MPIGFNNFGGSFKTGGIDSAKGKKNDGGSAGGTGYMCQRKKQEKDNNKEIDLNGSVFEGEGHIGFHIPSDEELEKMMKNQQNEDQTQENLKPQNEKHNVENVNSENNFFSSSVDKKEDNFFK